MGDFLLWFCGVVAFIIIVGIFAAVKSKKKRKQYEHIAIQIGFKINPDRSGYIESLPEDLLDGFRRLPMGKYHTHNKSFSFVLIKEEKERNTYIFDFWERKHSLLGLTVFESEVLINLNQNPSAENIVIQGHMQFEDFFPLKTPDSNTVRLQVQIMFDLVILQAAYPR